VSKAVTLYVSQLCNITPLEVEVAG